MALAAGLRLWLRRLRLKPQLLWTYNPMTTALFPVHLFEKLVYHCVDDIKAQPGMPAADLSRAEEQLVRASDTVFVTAPRLAELHSGKNPHIHYLPNVADYDHFASALAPETSIPLDLLYIPSPRLGFIGAVSSYKLDFQLIRTLAVARPDWSIVLIGQVGEGEPGTDISLLQGLPNLYFLGPKAYLDLPAYLKGIDVALLPNKLNDYTASMFPMKFFEYLAAGRPVVATALPALREFAWAARLTDSPDGFIEAVEIALSDTTSGISERQSLAKKHTYSQRTEVMLNIIQQDTES